MHRNAELPRLFQLESHEFRMTNFTYEEIEAENEKRLTEIRGEHEKRTIESLATVEKIRKRFFDDIVFPPNHR